MNKTQIIGGVIAIGVIALAIILLKPQETAAPTPDVATTPSMNEEAATTGMKMRHTMRELIGMGMALKCTYESTNGMGTAKGTTYVNGTSVRTDGTVTADGTSQTFSSLVDNDYIYTWGSAMPQGMKMRRTTAESTTASEGVSAQATTAADLDAAYDYDCVQWSVDTSMFVPPATVSFVDYDEMMKGMQGMMQGHGTDAGMMEGMEAYEQINVR